MTQSVDSYVSGLSDLYPVPFVLAGDTYYKNTTDDDKQSQKLAFHFRFLSFLIVSLLHLLLLSLYSFILALAHVIFSPCFFSSSSSYYCYDYHYIVMLKVTSNT